jgi:hypothetical protein
LRYFVRLKANGNWAEVQRNVNSGGLLAAWHGYLSAHWSDVLAEQSRRERSAVEAEVTRSRFGVIYLLGNTDYELDWTFFIGGVADVGGAVAAGALAGVGGSLAAAKDTGVGDIVTKLGTKTVTSGELIAGSKAVLKFGQQVVATPAHAPLARMNANPDYVAPAVYEPQFRVTRSIIDEIASVDYASLPEEMLPAAGMGILGGVMLAGVSGVVEGVAEVGYAMYTAIKSAISRAIEKFHDLCLQDSAFKVRLGGAMLRKIVEFVVTKVCEAAAPFVGGASNLASGVVDSVHKAVERTTLWWNKRQIQINSGHFDLIASAVEHQVDLAIGQGLYTALKGAGDIAANSFLPGAGSLVSMIMTALEWAYKLVSRLLQRSALNAFRVKAQELWDKEKVIAARHADAKYGSAWSETNSRTTNGEHRPRYEPTPIGDPQGSVIHRPELFREWFKEGCDASYIVPMLTLNSGMCGSIFEQIEMHAGQRRIDQSTFDAGVRYFSLLKKVSSRSLRRSGFTVTSKDTIVDGALVHAVRDHRDTTTGDKFVAGMGGNV